MTIAQDRSIGNWKTHIVIQLSKERKIFFTILLVDLFFGFMSIVTQVFLPDIIKMSGIEIVNLPEATLVTAFTDLLPDSVFIGSMILLYFGTTSLSPDMGVNKTMYYYLSRPVSRSEYLLSKILTRAVVILSSVMIANSVLYLVGLMFFDPIPFIRILLIAILIALGLIAFATLVIMLNTKLSTSQSLLVGIVTYLVMSLIGLLVPYFDWTRYLSIFSLTSYWQDILLNQDMSQYISTIFALIVWIGAATGIAVIIFRQRDI